MQDMGTFSFLLGHFVLVSVLLFSQKATADDITAKDHHVTAAAMGAIIDLSSRIGREEKVAMEMAVGDVFKVANLSLVLHKRDSQREPVQAALAAMDLINTQHVRAIFGPQAWEEASLVAEVGSEARVPIISLADATPPWATERWPFLVQASPNQNVQMNAIAAIVQSWGWHQVAVIYEDVESTATEVIPHLSEALREAGAEISDLVGLPPFASSSSSSSSLSEELERLKNGQCRVFVVHSSLPVAERLFETAMRMEMMEKDYVWITTNTITTLIDSIHASIVSSLQGIVGVKSYYSETIPNFRDFYSRFCKKFAQENPEEENHKPSIFAMQAYDAVWTVALAMEQTKVGGQQLLQKILLSDFRGVTGKVEFKNQTVAPAHIFQIVNVIGDRYREMGFWTYKLGFSGTIAEGATYNSSMRSCGEVFWPGGPGYVPRGWSPPTSANPLRIGVPTCSMFKQFVNVTHNDHNNSISFTGYTINLFKAMEDVLPYRLPHNFIPFNDTYDALVQQIHEKKFDAVVGDVAIIAHRYQYAEFTHPYTEPELVMIVPVRPKTSNQALLFTKPFTKAMWFLTALITLYNGFVVWLIERNYCSELKGSALNQMGTLLWLAFTTLFSRHGEKLNSNLSRLAMLVWLFVALVITQSYTASLTSMLTVQQLEPTIDNVELLRNSNARVGYLTGSFVANYLVDVLRFNPNNLKNLSSAEQYAQALRSKEIAAAFIEAPLAKLFLAKYCKSFILAGPTYKIGGFGFAFLKRSPLIPDISEALLNVSESGKLRQLENSMTGSEECEEPGSEEDEDNSLSPSSFWVLFVLTGGTSTVTLVVYIVRRYRAKYMLEHKTIWELILAVRKSWGQQRIRLSRKVSSVESPRNSASAPEQWVQIQTFNVCHGPEERPPARIEVLPHLPR